MMHARRDVMVGSRPLRRGRPAGFLFALLVLCLAVVPHVTIAASMMRIPIPSHAHQATAVASAYDQAEAGAPCHPANPLGHPASVKPPCCIVGCGLIAEAPVAPVVPERISWSRALPRDIPLAWGRSTEPAEPPPRTLPPT